MSRGGDVAGDLIREHAGLGQGIAVAVGRLHA
jgi:hypothetical protein